MTPIAMKDLLEAEKQLGVWRESSDPGYKARHQHRADIFAAGDRETPLCLLGHEFGRPQRKLDLQQSLAEPRGDFGGPRSRPHAVRHAHEKFVVTKENTEFRDLAISLCRRAGFEMQAAFEADHFDSLQAYTAVGMGVALIPQSTIVNTLTPSPRYIRITKPEAKRRLKTAFKLDKSWKQSALEDPDLKAMRAMITTMK